MKKKIKKGILFAVTVVFICIGFNSTVKSQSNNSKIQNQKEQIFAVVQSMPEYPGGENARTNFLANNIKYPVIARKAGVQGRVYVTFVVEIDGSITDVKTLRGIGSGCDEEAIRVVSSMPKWIPGKQKGKNVRVQYNLPIKFTLDDDASRDEEQIFLVVEEMPKYPGGDEARLKFLSDNIKYPEYARKKGIQGRVYVQFVIEKDGSVTGGMVLRGIDGGCDEEAVRVVKAMPKWIPGTQRGEPVRVQFNLPIQFYLNGKQSNKNKETRTLIFKVVEEMPSFPGGKEAQLEYLTNNMKYPEQARKTGVQGTVYVNFLVKEDGSIANANVLRGIGSGCDEEAVRIVSAMPKWNPGKQRGKIVAVEFNLPIKFVLN